MLILRIESTLFFQLYFNVGFIFIGIDALDQKLLVDIDHFMGSTMECHMHCIANPQCEAHTIRIIEGNTARSTSNLCNLHRFKTATDAEESISIPHEGDLTMIVTRGSISQSTLADRLLFIPKNTTTKNQTVNISSSAFIKIPKNYLNCTAIEEFDNDKYIFFWTDLPKKKLNPKLSVYMKNNFSKPLQDLDVNQIFEGYKEKDVFAVFSVDGIIYIRNENAWVKYKIQKTADNLLSSANKIGVISNQHLNKVPKAATTIGNDTILFVYINNDMECINKNTINDTQIKQPPPNEECTTLVHQLQRKKSLAKSASILGHDNATLLFLIDGKLYHLNDIP